MVKVWNKSEKFVGYHVFGYKTYAFVHSNQALMSAMRLFCLVLTLSDACMRCFLVFTSTRFHMIETNVKKHIFMYLNVNIKWEI